MRKQLLPVFTQFMFTMLPVRKTVFTAICLFLFNTSFAQQWTILGNESQVSATAATFTAIAVLDDVPYVVYREGTVSKVKKRNANGTWEQVGDNIGTNITYTRILLDKVNNLFVTYVDASNGNRLAVKCIMLNPRPGNRWTIMPATCMCLQAQ